MALLPCFNRIVASVVRYFELMTYLNTRYGPTPNLKQIVFEAFVSVFCTFLPDFGRITRRINVGDEKMETQIRHETEHTI